MNDRIFNIITHPLPRAMVGNDNHHVAASIAFDWQGAAADGEAAFAEFAELLTTLEWGLFTLRLNKDKPVEGRLDPMPLAVISAPNRAIDTSYIYKWLVRRKGTRGDEFWKTERADPTEPVTISSSQMNAGDALRATADWTGPVGHDLGLLRLFDLGATATALDGTLKPEEALVLLPFVAGNVPDLVTLVDTVDTPDFTKPVRFDYILDGAGPTAVTFEGLVLKGKELEAVPSEDRIPFIDPANGMVKLSDDPQRIATGLSRYRAFVSERHGLIHPALDAMQSNEFVSLLGTVFSEDKSAANIAATEVIDVVATIGALMLDPLILCLMMPGLGTAHPAEGDILARLIDAVLEAVDTARAAVQDRPDEFAVPDTILEKLDEAEKENALLNKLRDALKANPLLDSSSTYDFATAWLDTIQPEGLVRAILTPPPLKPPLTTPELEAKKLKELRVPQEVKEEEDGDKNDGESATDFASRLTTALGNIASDLATESGLEKVALRIIKETITWETVFGKTGTAEVDSVLARTWGSAFSVFEALLTGDFDGAEAARRSVVTLFTRSVTLPRTDNSSDGEGIGNWDDLVRSIKVDAFVHARIMGGPVAGGVSESTNAQIGMGAILWRGKKITANSPLGQALIKHDREVTQAFMDDLNSERFVPDTRPQPLAIQLAYSADAAASENFTDHYSGIGVLLRIADKKDNGWSSPNLAGLEWYGTDVPVYSGNGLTNRPFIETLQPLANDGICAGFVGYDGIPFSSRFNDESELVDTTFLPLFETDTYFCDPQETEGTCMTDSQTRVPELGYGKTYNIAEFAVAKGGLLPEPLRDPADPWVLITTGKDLSTYAKEIALRRRTAFTRPLIIENGGTRRLGHVPQDVLPLSLDYPREALGANDFRDFTRDAGGNGGLVVDKENGAERKIAIHGLRGKAGGTITLTLHRDPATAFNVEVAEPDKDRTELPIDNVMARGMIVLFRRVQRKGAGDGSVEWLVTTPAGDELTALITSTIEPGQRFWLRMTSDVAVSFDAPEEKAGSGSANADSSLLLIGPERKGLAEPVGKVASITVRHPAVTFVDFERWAVNPANLRNADKVAASAWLNLLRKASLLRGRDERLAEALNRLPDLAVDGLLLELVPTDSLGADVPVIEPQKILERKKLISHESVPIPENGDLIQYYLNKINGLQKAFDITIDVECKDGAATKIDDTRITASPGTVSALRIHLAVRKDHFHLPPATVNAPIDGGMAQLARRGFKQGSTEYLLFRGPEFQVEAIQPGLPDAVMTQLQKRFDIQPRGVSRLYDLAAVELGTAEDAQWRIVGRIDVHTQRWTPSGRPIYDFISPVEPETTADSPVAVFSHEDPERIKRFESQAFFGRPDYDENIVTVRVPPWAQPLTGNGASLLRTISWEGPTATYFRHRCTLRSRYQGAHEKPDAAARSSWEKDETGKVQVPWLKRAAVLADASRLEITRPQQRAIIPAHLALDRGDGATTLPLISTLQEAPFSVGGLADRIVADIVTGPGYHFANDATSVSIKDLRKEIGRDPRLTQSAIPTGQAAGLALATEGMIGLTNDPVAASSPSFTNSAVTLLPTDLGGSGWGDASETFVMTRLMRYMAPDWTFHAEPRDTDGRVPRWYEIVVEDLKGGEELRQSTKSGGHRKLARVCWDDQRKTWSVSVNIRIIDPSLKKTSFKELCRVSADSLEGLVLVHQPVSDVEFRLIVMARTVRRRGSSNDANALVGSGNQPVLIGAISWSDSKGDFASTPPVLLDAGKTEISSRACSFSAPTFAEWARTGKDFQMLTAIDSAANTSSVPANRLSAAVATDPTPPSKSTISFHRADDPSRAPLWLRPTQQLEPFAQHVHRHRVGLFFSVREGLHDTFPSYLGAARLDRRDNHIDADLVTMLIKGPPTDATAYCIILELDAPARPVASHSTDDVPASFRDFATHMVSPHGDSGLLFSGRILGLPEVTETLEFFLYNPDGDKLAKVIVPIPKGDGPLIKAFEIVIAPGANEVKVELIDQKGEALAPVPPEPLIPSVTAKLVIQAKAGDTVLSAWFDVTMHTLHATMTQTLSEWLIGEGRLKDRYGDADDSEDDAEDSKGDAKTFQRVLDPLKLTTLPEAQARIIAMSPAIRLN